MGSESTEKTFTIPNNTVFFGFFFFHFSSVKSFQTLPKNKGYGFNILIFVF